MDEERNLIIGFDFCDDFSQLCYYHEKKFEAESIAIREGYEDYLIPTVLAVKEDTKEWCYGDEAIALVTRNEGVSVEHLISKVLDGDEFVIYGIAFSAVKIIEKFFRKVLLLLKRYFPNDSIKQLMVTIEELDNRLVEVIYEALCNMGINKDRVTIQSHSQSYMYYAVSQKRELWMNDIGMFDFSGNGLKYYQISINHRNHPMVVGVNETDFTQTLTNDMLEKNETDNMEYVFGNIAKSVLYNQVVSTLYLTGCGFTKEWSEPVLKELCIGRRVFIGMNLYAKGACYAADSLKKKERFEDFVFISADSVTSMLSIKVYHDAKCAELTLISPARSWQETSSEVDLILDDQKEIEFTVNNVMKRESKKIVMTLEGLVNRPNKTTRVSVAVKCLDRETALVSVKDKGFGEFYQGTGQIWETSINL